MTSRRPGPRRPANPPTQQPRSAQPGPPGAAPHQFLNPFNFIATPERDVEHPDFGDGTPTSHESFAADTYSGGIEVTLTTRTPLLLVDQARARPATDHAPKRASTRRAGTSSTAPPLLNGSTVKGMLRSAFEAITNSRYGVVSARHTLPVAVRQQPSAMNRKSLKPALVLGKSPAGDWIATAVDALDLTEDATDYYPLESDTPLHPGPWVPNKYGPALAAALGLSGPTQLDNQVVEAWIHLQVHPADRGRRSFGLWRVSDIAPPGRLAQPSRPENPGWTVFNEPIKVRGRLLWTHSSFPAGGRKKHDERLVVTDILAGPGELFSFKLVVIPQQVARRFEGIIESFRRAHDTESNLEQKYGSYVWDPQRWRLAPGRTLYIELGPEQKPTAKSLYPAVIGREPFPLAPVDLIDEKHAPAQEYAALSPADRVFGWVHPSAADQPQSEPTAYRSNLRVDPPVCDSDTAAITTLESPIELGALNTPKTEQFRFYTADAKGYTEGTRLRGRKTFLPHRDTLDDTDYWKPRGATSRTREYLAAQPGNKPKIKTAVTSWVPIGTSFRTTIWVQNLSEAELAALLWLLTLPEGAVFGIGLGKPLGFGSVTVRADLDTTRLHTHDQMRQRYRHLTATPDALTPDALSAIADSFPERADRAGLRAVRQQFLESVTGFGGFPVHYPRLGRADGTASAPTETSYEWFVQNNKQSNPNALPALGGNRPPTLPYLKPAEDR
ncbi:TIGR03986 family type III CRISPR-associated RAMP protein [Nocardia fluminea]|uniref:CRISPR-associated protein (TIGR03986 family) n=1 Tax=Nocardia fluminea TaxID=134984 RepID=A0A2N3WYG8_9NOCA|nr:TIGR03986 family CRISPR-associated RAMP protein [Nocardia fluminea]PKV98900.1 CRISPR-associated protein (TIGR03986 family) [Nocardia fluminea]